jgi:hypothetical protein
MARERERDKILYVLAGTERKSGLSYSHYLAYVYKIVSPVGILYPRAARTILGQIQPSISHLTYYYGKGKGKVLPRTGHEGTEGE